MRLYPRNATAAGYLSLRWVPKSADLDAQLVCVVLILKTKAVANLHRRSNLLEHITAVAEVNSRSTFLHVVFQGHNLLIFDVRNTVHGTLARQDAREARRTRNPISTFRRSIEHVLAYQQSRKGGGGYPASNQLLPGIYFLSPTLSPFTRTCPRGRMTVLVRY